MHLENYIYLSLYFILISLYSILIFLNIKSFIMAIKNKSMTPVDFKLFLKKIALVNLILPYLSVTMVINFYPNVYSDDYGTELLPPVATFFAFIGFILFLFLIIYGLRNAQKYGYYQEKDFIEHLFYRIILTIILFGTTLFFTTLVGFIERLIIGLY